MEAQLWNAALEFQCQCLEGIDNLSKAFEVSHSFSILVSRLGAEELSTEKEKWRKNDIFAENGGHLKHAILSLLHLIIWGILSKEKEAKDSGSLHTSLLDDWPWRLQYDVYPMLERCAWMRGNPNTVLKSGTSMALDRSRYAQFQCPQKNRRVEREGLEKWQSQNLKKWNLAQSHLHQEQNSFQKGEETKDAMRLDQMEPQHPNGQRMRMWPSKQVEGLMDLA